MEKNKECIKKPVWNGRTNIGKSIIVLMSGGLDSSVLLYKTLQEYPRVLAVGFDYGQKNKNELDAAKIICRDFGVDYRILDANFIANISGDIYMFNKDIQIDWASKNFVVPFRNGFFIEMASVIAYNENYQYIALGALLEEQAGSDKNKKFLSLLQRTINEGIGDGFNIKLITPFIDTFITKPKVFKLANEYGILKYLDAHIVTCYEGAVGLLGCKKCLKCQILKLEYDLFQLKYGEKNAE